MAKNSYFINFPLISYQGSPSVDIMERVVFLDETLKNPFLFYPYDVADEERPDQFANRYYGDSYKSWILYLSNQMIDPYYEWYMTQEVFYKFIIKKYGSIQAATNKITYYENNWYMGETLNVNGFDALLPTLIKYWEPVYGNNNKIAYYKRKQTSQSVNTNRIASYTVSSNSFIKDEICSINFDSSHIGQGQVLSTANNVLFLKHLSGYYNTTVSANSYVFGTESMTNTHISSVSSVADNLLPEEEVYFTPVSYIDYENAKNEYNKSILVYDVAYSANLVNSLKTLLT